MNLYTIDKEIMDCLVVDEDTGEVTVDEARLSGLQMERDKKLEQLGLWVVEMRSDIAALKEEEKRLAERRAAIERRAERVKDALARSLDGNRFSTGLVSMSFRKSTSVQIDDAEFYNGGNLEYCKTTVTADKAKIKDALKQGFPVHGARLVESNNIQIK